MYSHTTPLTSALNALNGQGFSWEIFPQENEPVHETWYDMIYLLTAIELTPGGSSTVHIYTQIIHRMTTTKIYRTTQKQYINNTKINWNIAGRAPSW
jgi:hypothetical protein